MRETINQPTRRPSILRVFAGLAIAVGPLAHAQPNCDLPVTDTCLPGGVQYWSRSSDWQGGAVPNSAEAIIGIPEQTVLVAQYLDYLIFSGARFGNSGSLHIRDIQGPAILVNACIPLPGTSSLFIETPELFIAFGPAIIGTQTDDFVNHVNVTCDRIYGDPILIECASIFNGAIETEWIRNHEWLSPGNDQSLFLNPAGAGSLNEGVITTGYFSKNITIDGEWTQTEQGRLLASNGPIFLRGNMTGGTMDGDQYPILLEGTLRDAKIEGRLRNFGALYGTIDVQGEIRIRPEESGVFGHHTQGPVTLTGLGETRIEGVGSGWATIAEGHTLRLVGDGDFAVDNGKYDTIQNDGLLVVEAGSHEIEKIVNNSLVEFQPGSETNIPISVEQGPAGVLRLMANPNGTQPAQLAISRIIGGIVEGPGGPILKSTGGFYLQGVDIRVPVSMPSSGKSIVVIADTVRLSAGFNAESPESEFRLQGVLINDSELLTAGSLNLGIHTEGAPFPTLAGTGMYAFSNFEIEQNTDEFIRIERFDRFVWPPYIYNLSFSSPMPAAFDSLTDQYIQHIKVYEQTPLSFTNCTGSIVNITVHDEWLRIDRDSDLVIRRITIENGGMDLQGVLRWSYEAANPVSELVLRNAQLDGVSPKGVSYATLAGTINNNIDLQFASPGSTRQIHLEGPVTLTGPGAFVMGTSGDSDRYAFIPATPDNTPPASLTNAAGHTIRGTIMHSVPIDNFGVLDLSHVGSENRFGGPLTLHPGSELIIRPAPVASRVRAEVPITLGGTLTVQFLGALSNPEIGSENRIITTEQGFTGIFESYSQTGLLNSKRFELDYRSDGVYAMFYCGADFNGDNLADLTDINVYIQRFLDNDPSADTNGDGIIDLGDIASFVQVFLAGC